MKMEFEGPRGTSTFSITEGEDQGNSTQTWFVIEQSQPPCVEFEEPISGKKYPVAINESTFDAERLTIILRGSWEREDFYDAIVNFAEKIQWQRRLAAFQAKKGGV